VEEDGLFIAENGSWDKELQELQNKRGNRTSSADFLSPAMFQRSCRS
jgi:hypothetical protein